MGKFDEKKLQSLCGYSKRHLRRIIKRQTDADCADIRSLSANQNRLNNSVDINNLFCK